MDLRHFQLTHEARTSVSLGVVNLFHPFIYCIMYCKEFAFLDLNTAIKKGFVHRSFYIIHLFDFRAVHKQENGEKKYTPPSTQGVHYKEWRSLGFLSITTDLKMRVEKLEFRSCFTWTCALLLYIRWTWGLFNVVASERE